MLFNSIEFIYLFLPITLVVFLFLKHKKQFSLTVGWLIFTSLFFYGWWNPKYLILLLVSVVVNYYLGKIISLRHQHKWWLMMGVTFNLSLLGYFKYANFFVEQIEYVSGHSFSLPPIILPLAISFFTFQQIAYLVDVSRGIVKDYNFQHYCLFVTFFPQLIAGPIVHHKEVMPQFESALYNRIDLNKCSLGLITFSIGLFKKVIFADNLAVYATPVFGHAEVQTVLPFFDAWLGVIAYSLQLYFDFSGYSDMAIGLALLFGIQLPKNFNSPYKAVNIVDFWRRWHITLSQFLRDYLYIALGGNRKGKIRRYSNLLLTMLLGGLWHGAGWTFIIWGCLHGGYLVINHLWSHYRANFSIGVYWPERFFMRLLTLLAVMVGWVYFRAESFAGANTLLYSMFLPQEVILPSTWDWLAVINTTASATIPYDSDITSMGIFIILPLLMVALLSPNSQQIAEHINQKISLESTFAFGRVTYSMLTGSVFAMLFLICLLNLSNVSEFLYFQF